MLLRLADGALGFVPASEARRLTSLSSLLAVPGVEPPAFGIALADGAVVTVLRLTSSPASPRRSDSPAKPTYEPGADWVVPGADRAVLCRVGGFDVALTGATVLATGVFDAGPGDPAAGLDGESVLWRGEAVPIIDVRALYAQAEAATWAERAVTSAPRAISRPAPASVPASATASAPPSSAPPAADEGRPAMLPGLPGPPALPGRPGERGSRP